jgi:hypothetical protein
VTACVLLGAIAAIATSTAPAEISLHVRAPLWVAINVPAKRFASASVSEMVEIADRVVRRTTDFRAAVVPDQVVQRCAENSETAVACMARSTKEGRFMLVISAIEEDRAVSLVVDLDAPGTPVLKATLPTGLRDHSEIEKYLDEFLGRDLVEIFDRAGARTLGSLEVAIATPEGANVVFDGKNLGASRGTLTIRDVDPGPHVLHVEQPGYSPVDLTVEVRPMAKARIDVELRDSSIAINRAARQATFYAGLAAGAAGIALGAIGLAKGTPSCVDGGECPRSLLHPLIPPGYSLIGMGAAWSIGAWLGGEDDFPWIELIAGVVIFGASYGMTLAFDGRCGEGCYDLR